MRFLLPPLMLSAGLLFGLLSARYVMDTASRATLVGDSKWQEITPDFDSLSSTYLAGHFLSRGETPPPNGVRILVRQEDDDGNTLRGNCLVQVEGKLPKARWFFVSAVSGSNRNALDAGATVREANGDYIFSLSTTAAPGNWLAPPTDGPFELHLVLQGVTGATTSEQLPRVRRLWC